MDPQPYLEGSALREYAPPVAVESFTGFAVLGAAFETGHMLALRHFEGSSHAEGFTSVWMREPNGDWRFFSTNPPSLGSCAHYMQPDVADQTPIDIRWVDGATLHVSIKAIGLRWFIEFDEDRRTRFMSAALTRIPSGLLRTRAMSSFAAFIARNTLRAGKLRLHGTVPNGQRFAGLPRNIWRVKRSVAWASAYNFGEMVRPGKQERFGDRRMN